LFGQSVLVDFSHLGHIDLEVWDGTEEILQITGELLGIVLA
jgi:hypothetical protein